MADSKRVIENVVQLKNGGDVLDCGVGVGRVTRFVLLSAFSTFDLVDASQKLLRKARRKLAGHPGVREFYHTDLVVRLRLDSVGGWVHP